MAPLLAKSTSLSGVSVYEGNFWDSLERLATLEEDFHFEAIKVVIGEKVRASTGRRRGPHAAIIPIWTSARFHIDIPVRITLKAGVSIILQIASHPVT